MAVFPGWSGNLANGGTGTLEITDDCVLLDNDSADLGTMLLVWGDEMARWVPDEEAIYFDNQADPPVLLHTGDRIDIGGSQLGSIDPDTGDITDTDTGRSRPFPWLSTPAVACQQHVLWSVSIAKRLP